MQYIIVEKRIFMDTYELVVPCHFGLEAVTKREIYDLGYEITRVEDGRVTFAGDAEAVPLPPLVTVTMNSVGAGASFSKTALTSTLALGMVNLSSLIVTLPLMTCHSLKW